MNPVHNNLVYNCSDGLVDCTVSCNLTELWYCGFTYAQHYDAYMNGSPRVRNISVNKIIMAIVIFMVSTFTMAAELVVDDTGLVTGNKPISYELAGEVYDLVGNNGSYLDTTTGIVYANFTLQEVNGNATAGKRATMEVRRWTQYQKVQSGTWWSEWYPISRAVETGRGSTASIALGYSWSYTWSINPSLNIAWNSITGILGGSISMTESETKTFTCNIPANSAGQVWYQKEVMWADVQYQGCMAQFGAPTRCGAWSQYYRVNAPMKGELSKHIGCSVGWDNVRWQ